MEKNLGHAIESANATLDNEPLEEDLVPSYIPTSPTAVPLKDPAGELEVVADEEVQDDDFMVLSKASKSKAADSESHSWGPYWIAHKGPRKDAKFGSWEGQCKFHCKSFWKPVCTQKKTILEGTPDCKEATLNIVKWWLLQSQYCKSARGYSACNPRAEEFIPDRSVLEQQLKDVPPAPAKDEVITDDFLSDSDVSKPKLAAKAKPAAKRVSKQVAASDSDSSEVAGGDADMQGNNSDIPDAESAGGSSEDSSSFES